MIVVPCACFKSLSYSQTLFFLFEDSLYIVRSSESQHTSKKIWSVCLVVNRTSRRSGRPWQQLWAPWRWERKLISDVALPASCIAFVSLINPLLFRKQKAFSVFWCCDSPDRMNIVDCLRSRAQDSLSFKWRNGLFSGGPEGCGCDSGEIRGRDWVFAGRMQNADEPGWDRGGESRRGVKHHTHTHTGIA